MPGGDDGPILTGDHVLLRRFTPDDEADVHAFASDPQVVQWTDWGPNGIEDTRSFLADAVAEYAAHPRSRYPFAAVEAATGRVVGSAEILVTSTAHRSGTFGYVFHRDVWSRGYATDASRLLVRFGFEQLGLRRISATCHPDNRASARVLEKAGLTFEGRMRDHMLVHGVWRDSLLFAVTSTARDPGA